MTIKKQHFQPSELADWQTAVDDKDLTTSPGSPSEGDKYIIAGTGGDWSAGAINDIVWYIDSSWFFITPFEGMQVYIKDENLYYFYNGSSWASLGGTGGGDMSKSTYDTDNNGIVDKAESIDDDNGNVITASEIISMIYNIVLLAFYRAVDNSKTIYNLVNGFIDEYEDESGIDTISSINETYDASGNFYQPTVGSVVPAPYAHYKCNDDIASTTVTDDGSGVNNGTSSTNTSNLSVTGKINDAFDFVGANSEYLNIDNLMTDVASDQFGSISFWANTAGAYVISFGDTNANNLFYIYVQLSGSTATLQLDSYTGGTKLIDGSATKTGLSAGWHHYAVVQDGVGIKFYIDGEERTITHNGTTDYGGWLGDITGIDNGRVMCINKNNNGNYAFSNGSVDDIRYYKYTLNDSEVSAIYNSGSGTEDETPSTETLNMTLISEAQSAETEPDTARIVIFEENIDSIILNTDLKTYISRDNGSTWVLVTLSDEGDYATSKRVLVGSADLTLSGIGSGTDMIYKHVTDNSKRLKIHSTALLWD